MLKRIVAVLFFMMCANPLYAEEKIFIQGVTGAGLDAAEKALDHRKWTITDKDDSSIKAKIARFGKDTRADIVIYYRDNNLYYDGAAFTQVQKKKRNSSQRQATEVEIPIPEGWVRNLQKDTTRFYVPE